MSRKQVLVVFWDPGLRRDSSAIFYLGTNLFRQRGNSVGARDFSPIGNTVISGLKSRAPTTTNINLSDSLRKLWDTCDFFTQIVKKCLTMVRGVLNLPCIRLIEAVMH